MRMPTRTVLHATLVATPTLVMASASGVSPDHRAVFEVEPLSLAAFHEGHDHGAPLDVEITAGAWLPRPGGDVTFGGTAMAIELEEDLGVDELETIPVAEVRIARGRAWDLHFSGFDFDTDADRVSTTTGTFGTVNFTPGDALHSTFDFTSAHVELVFTAISAAEIGHDSPVDLRFSIGPGFRYVDADFSITANGTSTDSAGGEWSIPYAALMMDFLWDDREDAMPWLETLRIRVAGGAGAAVGGDGGSMWYIRAGLGWGVTERIEFLFGYRLVELDVDDDTLNLDAGLQGLYLGGRITF